jgi:hypothetical protein
MQILTETHLGRPHSFLGHQQAGWLHSSFRTHLCPGRGTLENQDEFGVSELGKASIRAEFSLQLMTETQHDLHREPACAEELVRGNATTRRHPQTVLSSHKLQRASRWNRLKLQLISPGNDRV